MTPAASPRPIAYGHDTSGRAAVIDTAGPCPHVLVTGGTGRGLTTLAQTVAVQAARQGTLVLACRPLAADGTPARGIPGILAGSGPGETLKLIRQARAEMRSRLTAMPGGASSAGHRPVLLAVDDYDRLTGAVPDDDRAGAVTAITEIAVLGRAARVTVLLTTRMLSRLPPALMDNLGTRIILGPAAPRAARMLFGDAQAGRDIPPGTRGAGTALTLDSPAPAAIRVTPLSAVSAPRTGRR